MRRKLRVTLLGAPVLCFILGCVTQHDCLRATSAFVLQWYVLLSSSRKALPYVLQAVSNTAYPGNEIGITRTMSSFCCLLQGCLRLSSACASKSCSGRASKAKTILVQETSDESRTYQNPFHNKPEFVFILLRILDEKVSINSKVTFIFISFSSDFSRNT